MSKTVSIKEETLAVVAAIILLVAGLTAALMSTEPTAMVVKDCHKGALGSWNYCSRTCPCEVGVGDCDTSFDCRPGLKCMDNAGPKFNQDSWVDVCVKYDYYLDQISDKNTTYTIKTVTA